MVAKRCDGLCLPSEQRLLNLQVEREAVEGCLCAVFWHSRILGRSSFMPFSTDIKCRPFHCKVTVRYGAISAVLLQTVSFVTEQDAILTIFGRFPPIEGI